MSKHNVFFMVILLTLSACGDGTVRVNKTRSNLSDPVAPVSPEAEEQDEGTFNYVATQAPNGLGQYYSFSGLIHTHCYGETTRPVCSQGIPHEYPCDIGIPGCEYNPNGTYTSYAEHTYVNECSWRKAGSPPKKYIESRPCRY